MLPSDDRMPALVQSDTSDDEDQDEEETSSHVAQIAQMNDMLMAAHVEMARLQKKNEKANLRNAELESIIEMLQRDRRMENLEGASPLNPHHRVSQSYKTKAAHRVVHAPKAFHKKVWVPPQTNLERKALNVLKGFIAREERKM